MRLVEGFADAMPSKIQEPGGEQTIWRRIEGRPERDMRGEMIPVGSGEFAVDMLNSSSNFVIVGEVRDGKIVRKWDVEAREMKRRGISY